MTRQISGQLNIAGLDRIAPARAPRTEEGGGLTFSAHARNRLASRNIRFDAQRMDQLARATDQAAAKGARDSLVVLDDLGLIVNVPSRTVVTALDGERMNNGVFTNIDSTVILRDQ